MRNKVALLIPYFGTLPNYFSFYGENLLKRIRNLIFCFLQIVL